MAIAEKGEAAIINIYDISTFRRKKPLVYPDLGSDHFVCVAFSADGKYCVAQGGYPEWNLVLWAWEKTKVVAMLKTIVQTGATAIQVDFCPTDSSTICVSGNGTIKFFKLIEGALSFKNDMV